MRRIRKTKHPSFRQMKKMSINLQRKYKTMATIQAMVWAFESGNNSESFWMDVKGIYAKSINSWQEVQAEYRRLMKGV